MTGADLRLVLSKNLKLFRKKRSLSQIELAEKADISIPFLSNIERCNKWPYPDTLARLAAALEVEIHTLFQEQEPEKPEYAQNRLEQFKKDIAVSLHKTVSLAINNSLETIGNLYTTEKNDCL